MRWRLRISAVQFISSSLVAAEAATPYHITSPFSSILKKIPENPITDHTHAHLRYDIELNLDLFIVSFPPPFGLFFLVFVLDSTLSFFYTSMIKALPYARHGMDVRRFCVLRLHPAVRRPPFDFFFCVLSVCKCKYVCAQTSIRPVISFGTFLF